MDKLLPCLKNIRLFEKERSLFAAEERKTAIDVELCGIRLNLRKIGFSAMFNVVSVVGA
ncbi:MAG: hypothetical protein MZW92_71830 [Comamonadaceae bacterium]|nr:hypothetical protein [Comamonadaceae bacterium]